MNGDEMTQADILIVDDTIENLQLLSNMLKAQGYRVRPVPSGPLALQAVEAIPPDLILLDINMPLMDGYEVCERLKAREGTRDIPVIFISAFSETVSKVRALEIGGVDYVTKPFQIEEVLARVEVHLEIRRLRLEVEEKNWRLEESLARQRELEQLKDRLVQMIVHDLKNPLNAIVGNSYLLLEEVPSDAAATEMARDVAESAQRMHRMVLNILDVMGLGERELRPRRSSVDLGDLVASAIGTIRPLALRDGREIAARTRTPVPKIPLDRDLIQRVVENLLENALKYSPKGTQVTVAYGMSPEGEIAIDTMDQGPGVPEDQRAEIFQVYARLGRDRGVQTRKSWGLGLAFCKLAVEAHGGRIWIDDADPPGAAVRIRIPTIPLDEPPDTEAQDG